MKVEDIQRLGEVTFGICVMWVAGWSIGRIALVTERSPGAIRGIVHRKLEVPRDDMTMADRQVLLDLLKANRRDGGKLPNSAFAAMEMSSKQQARLVSSPLKEPPEDRRVRTPQLPRPRPAPAAEVAPQKSMEDMTPSERKQFREDRRVQRAEQRLIEEQKPMGFADRRGEKASALEYLANRKMLADYQDRINETLGPQKMTSTGVYRLECGHRLRNYFDGERIGGMGAVDYGRSGGGGGATALPISAYRLQCIHALGEIKTLMTKEEFLLIERLVDHDDFLWEPYPDDKRRPIFDAIRRILDIVAVYERLIDEHTYYSRWNARLPMVTRIKRGAIQKQSREAARVLAGAKR